MKKKFKISSHGHEFLLSYNPEESCFRPVINGKSAIPDCRPLAPGVWSLILDKQPFILHVSGEYPDINVTVNGSHVDVKLQNDMDLLLDIMGLKDALAAKDTVIKASIPGLVKKIEVSPGQKIEKGDGLLILEAMKMENEIKAPVSGIVGEINVTEGQAIEKNMKIMEIKPE